MRGIWYWGWDAAMRHWCWDERCKSNLGAFTLSGESSITAVMRLMPPDCSTVLHVCVRVPLCAPVFHCVPPCAQWRSEGPADPATAGGPAGLKGPARGPPGRSSRRNPLTRGPNKLFAGGPENRRYATACATMGHYMPVCLCVPMCATVCLWATVWVH